MILRSHTKKQANAAATATFLAIPEAVVHYYLLPRFGLHDILSLRAACHWTKYLTEGYLRTHPLSKETVDIFLELPDDDDMSLASFLRASSIPKPVSRFRLNFAIYVNALRNPHLPEFLQRYGPQVEDLCMSEMRLPKRHYSAELDFFSGLPNLKNLTINWWNNCNLCNRQRDDFMFPVTFQNLAMIKLESNFECLRPFKMTRFVLAWHSELSLFWELINFCNNLEYLCLPRVVEYEPLLLELLRILNLGHHKNFQFLDLYNYSHSSRPGVPAKQLEYELIADISDFAPDRKIKILNIQANNLRDFNGENLRRTANQVVSITYLNHTFSVVGIPFPNVSEIKHLAWPALPLELQRITDSLTRALFPGLRKLDIAIDPSAPGQSLEILWREFCNLEELALRRGYARSNPADVEYNNEQDDPDDDRIFFGSVRAQPAFLQLTELKVLTLEVGSGQMGHLSNAVFSDVLRHMGLRELHLKSEGPIASFTVSGIRALLTGRFRETIEHFPFLGWSLANLRQEQFQRLAKKFFHLKS